MIVVFLTFNPLFDANILNHINDMISTGQTEAKFHMPSPWDGGTKV